MQDISTEVLAKASEGDLKSFELIYRSASRFVYNVAFRIVGNQETAEEVTQEVFLIVYHKLKGFRFESSFKTWVYRISVNCAINHYRKESKAKNRRADYDEEIHPVITMNETEKQINKEYQEETVSRLLSLLNPDQRACIVLRSIEGLSYQQMADVLKININTVRSRLKRAREILLDSRKEVTENEM